MEFTVQNLCGFLIRSKLMSPEGMRAMHLRWQAEARDNATNATQFIKWIISNQYVTEYQGALLSRGHADDFFVNQYMILERLGRGRMAGVYKAAHPLGQIVAIKILPPSKAKDPQVLGRFEREAELSAKLKHPNVVRTFQVGKSSDLHYLVMEYLEGETLEEVLQRRKKLPPGEAVRLMHQALSGLQHIHEQGMVHRDLKPSNLMLISAPGPGEPDNTLKATVKILDIGLGRQIFEEGQAPDLNSDLTAEGVLLGTPDYLAPEQARDPRTIDVRADIYSLGCVLYHAITGQPPFPDTNILSQMVRHATEAPKPLRDFNPQIPDGLQQIVNWMMAKQPAERYPTPERAAQALQMYLLADNVPAKAIDDAPQMKKYLTWLEAGAKPDTEESDTINLPPGVAVIPAKPPSTPVLPAATQRPAKPAAPAMAAPVMTAPPLAQTAVPAKPVAPEPTPASVLHTQRAERTEKKKKHRDRKDAPAATPTAAPAGAAAAVSSNGPFDVELIPAEELVGGPTPLSFATMFPAGTRDWVVFGLGAAAMLVFVLILWLIATLASGGGTSGVGVE